MIGFAITPFIVIGAALGTVLGLIDLRRPKGTSRAFQMIWAIGLTTFVSVMLAICVGVTISVFTFPHYQAKVVQTLSEVVEERQDDGRIQTTRYSRAVLQFTGPNGGILTLPSRIRSTSGPNQGDTVRVAYRDGVLFELSGTSKLLYSIMLFFTALGLIFFRFLLKDTCGRPK